MNMLEKFNPMQLFQEFERHFAPRMVEPLDYELYEGEDDFLIVFPLPGFEKDEISVEYKDGTLHIAAEKRETVETENENGEKVKQDRTVRRLYNSFHLSDRIDTDRINVKLEDGLLRVVLPRSEAARPRKIEVK